MAKKPTIKQQRFIDLYDGNLTAAAKKAKISVSYAKKIVSNSVLLGLIKDRERERNKTSIASREERQEFWTESMRNNDLDIKDRQKSSELLGRSEADFTDIKRHVGKDGKDLIWVVKFGKSEENGK